MLNKIKQFNKVLDEALLVTIKEGLFIASLLICASGAGWLYEQARVVLGF